MFNYGYGFLESLCLKLYIFYYNIVPEERAVLVREQASSLYEVPAYFFAKVLGEIPFSFQGPVVISLMLYWTVPFREGADHYFILCTLKLIIVVTMFLVYHVGASYSLLIGSLITDRESLISISPVFSYISIAPKYSFNDALRILC